MSKKEEYMVVNKFIGSWGIVILLCFLFLPGAIIYYIVKRTPTRVKVQ